MAYAIYRLSVIVDLDCVEDWPTHKVQNLAENMRYDLQHNNELDRASFSVEEVELEEIVY